MTTHEGFTPGPWEASGHHAGGWDIRGDGVWVGSVMDPHCDDDDRPSTGFPSMKEGRANARLIADAPRLYAESQRLREALDDLVQRCDGPDGVRADGSNIETIAAHAALGDFNGED